MNNPNLKPGDLKLEKNSFRDEGGLYTNYTVSSQTPFVRCNIDDNGYNARLLENAAELLTTLEVMVFILDNHPSVEVTVTNAKHLIGKIKG